MCTVPYFYVPSARETDYKSFIKIEMVVEKVSNKYIVFKAVYRSKRLFC